MKDALNLPPVSPSAVKSFWIVSSSLAILALLAIDGFRLSLPSAILPALLLLLVLFSSLLYGDSPFFRTPYIYVIRIIRGAFLPLAKLWITSAVFYAIIFPNRLFGSPVQGIKGNSPSSMWYARAPSDPDPKLDTGVVMWEKKQHQRWLRLFLGRVIQSKSRWHLTLVPFLALLSLLKSGPTPSSVPTDTYTLY